MPRIHGITVTLWKKDVMGTDPLGMPVYAETTENVENVLVASPTTQELIDMNNLYGKKAVYTLGIPKGDTHDWEDVRVSFFGQDFKTFGLPIEGIEDLVPLDWNKKVMVARYE